MRRFLALIAVVLMVGCVPIMDPAMKPDYGQTDTPDYSITPDITNAGSRAIRNISPRKTGTIRIYGVLNSVGMFYGRDGKESMANLAGASWTQTDYGDFGRGGNDIAWFYADIEPTTGKVIYARAYMVGSYGRADAVGDMRNPLNGSYGKITKNSWEITITGLINLTIQGTDDDANGVLVLRGNGDILSSANRQRFQGRYVLNNYFSARENPAKIANWKKLKNNCDYGNVTFSVLRSVTE